MGSCKIDGCPHPVSAYQDDGCCIFHTKTGKIKGYDRDKPIFIKPDERSKKAQIIVKEFIQSFSKMLVPKTKDKSQFVCARFIFPILEVKEWRKMWSPISELSPKKRPKIKLDFSVSFTKAIFGGTAGFKNATFCRETDFSSARFCGEADFEDVKFVSNTDFSRAEFVGEAKFTDTEFNDKAIFAVAKFLGCANFWAAKFDRDVNFYAAEFNDPGLFQDVDFSNEASFIGAKFVNRASFKNAKFSGKAYFNRVEFESDVFFKNTKFHCEATFMATNFGGKAIFEGFSITEKCTFTAAKFHQEADFSNAIMKLVDYTRCEISSFLRLRQIRKQNNKEDREVTKESPIILLRDLRFWENGHILIEDIDISRVSFWQTNLHVIRPRVDFIRVNWGTKKFILDDIYNRPEYKKWKSDELQEKEWNDIFEPIEKTENKEEEIERCYKQIKLIYETSGYYPDAGEFYLLEMDARRRKPMGLLIEVLHFLYWLVSDYGERVGRAFLWFVGFLFVSALSFAFAGFEKSDEIFKLLPQFNFSQWRTTICTLINSFIAVVNSIFLSGVEPYRPVNTWGSAILVIAKILGLAVLALLLLAIRRRFRR